MRLDLSDRNDYHALVSALDNYLNGVGMEDGDEDEAVLERIYETLRSA